MKKTLALLFAILCGINLLLAQPSVKKVQIILVPDHASATYKLGEQASFKVMLLDCGHMLNGAEVKYQISQDLMPVHKEGSVKLDGYEGQIKAGTMKEPGYLRVKAIVEHEGTRYTALSTVGYEAEKLMPVVQIPEDFEEFWEGNIALLDKVELDPKMELLEDRCTDKVLVYHISYGNIGNSRMYGVLTMPKAEGKYPAILRMPGAGVHAKGGNITNAEQGAIILELGIHGIPVNLEGPIYDDLTNGPLSSYYTNGIENRDTYYFKRVYLGCVKGVDFLLSLPQCNGKIGTLGGSQGGTLSIVTSRLDKRISATAIYFPAFSDWEGYLAGRTGGFPHYFRNKANRTKEKLETVRYYDAANFAKGLTAPVFFAYGYNDITCGPTTSRATYNAITAPKTLVISENTGHWLYPEHNRQMWNWIIDELNRQAAADRLLNSEISAD